jgi:transcriptional regulator with XRE-family HTH domain
MARRAGPSARSRRLARTLRTLRAETGASAAEVGKAVGMSGSKINRIEAAEIGIYQDDLEKLLDHYRVSRKRRTDLLTIARNAEQRCWMRMRNPNLPADLLTWTDFEDEATALRLYEPMTVPDLLQTAEYARAITAATGTGLTESQRDALVTTRLARQSLLTKEHPLRLHAIVEETILTRPFGDNGVLGRQLRHLVDAASQPNVVFQVLPTDAGLHPGVNGAFVVLEYDDGPSLVCLEHLLVSHFLEEEEQIQAYAIAWDVLVKLARSPEESVEIVRKLTV